MNEYRLDEILFHDERCSFLRNAADGYEHNSRLRNEVSGNSQNKGSTESNENIELTTDRTILEISTKSQSQDNENVGENIQLTKRDECHQDLTNKPSDNINSTANDKTVRLLQAENRALKDQLLCNVCKKSSSKELFLPSGNMYACADCSKQLTHCPSCSKKILGTVTVYFS